MRSQATVIGLLFAAIGTAVAPATVKAEEDVIIALASDGKWYQLTGDRDGSYRWEAASPDGLVDQPRFKRTSQEFGSVEANLRITAEGRIAVDRGSRGVWETLPLNPPPSGAFVYKRAHIDSSGNVFVELGGQSPGVSGFNYVSKDGDVVVSRKQVWDGDQPPAFVKMVGNPKGSGLIGLTADGALWCIRPPNPPEREFSAFEILPPGRANDMHLANRVLLVMPSSGQKGGVLSVVSRDFKGDPLTPIIDADQIRFLNVISSADPEAGIDVASAELRYKEGVAIVPVGGSAKPKGHVQTDAEGRLVRYDSDGNVMAPPRSAFEAIRRDPVVMQTLIPAISRIMTDEIALDEHFLRSRDIFGRDDELMAVFETLARQKGKNPVLVGEAGVGKTAVAELLARKVFSEEIPVAAEFQRILSKAIVIETSPAQISMLAVSNAKNSQAAAVDQFVASVKHAEKLLGRRIIVFIDEIHTFEEAQLQALKRYLDSRDGLLIVGASTHGEFGMMLQRDPAIRRRFQRVDVPEFSVAQTRRLLQESIVPDLIRHYRAKDGRSAEITDDALDAVIRSAKEYLPDSARPEGPYKLLQSVVVHQHRLAEGGQAVVTAQAVGEYVAEKLRLPLNPFDPNTFVQQLDDLRGKLNRKVVDQPQLVDAFVDLWRDVQMAAPGEGSHRVMLIAGPTGVGKTHSARVFTEFALGDSERMLEVDCNRYATGGLSLNSLLGAPPGIISSDKTRGLLPEFLDGRGRGTNVVVFNEFDKAHPDLAKAIMELMDTGKLQAADGNTYYLGKSIIVLTTNKGSHEIYPRESGRALSRKELLSRLSRFTDKVVKEFFLRPDPKDLYDNSKTLPPEVVQRIHRAVPAVPPSREGAIEIAFQEAERMGAKYEEIYGYRLRMDHSVAERIVDRVYVGEDGVRSVIQSVRSALGDAIATAARESSIEHGMEIRVGTIADDPGSFAVLTSGQENGRLLGTLKAPVDMNPIENPLEDPETRKNLLTLEERVRAHVFGQDEAVRLTLRSIKARVANTALKTPATALYLGSTATGKTELARAVALELYGDVKRHIKFDMGSVKWQGDLNSLFGSARGIVGSDTLSPFEKFLQDYPEGGVVIFDEIGNMGGGQSGAENVKEDLLKVFYPMLDDGVWTSALGKKYDLRKFTFIFTSNEGQELFQKLPSDDLRISAWKENRSKEKLIDLLKEHRWPEALLGRLKGNLILFKPLIHSERIQIAEKLLQGTVKPILKQHGLSGVEFSPRFYDSVAEIFFSHTQGARKMNDFATETMTEIINDFLFEAYDDPKSLTSSKLVIDIEDNYRGLEAYTGKTPPERKVLLTLRAEREGQVVRELQRDVTSDAVERRLVSEADQARVAFHEAGHAIGNDPVYTGRKVEFITIRGEGSYGGYTRYVKAGSQVTISRESVIAHIGSLLSGQEAEKIAGFGPSSGWSDDLKRARSFALDAITRMGLSENALGLPLNERGEVDARDKRVQDEVKRLLEEGGVYAREKLEKNRAILEELKDLLIKNVYANFDEIDPLLARVEGIDIETRFTRPLSEKAGCNLDSVVDALSKLE